MTDAAQQEAGALDEPLFWFLKVLEAIGGDVPAGEGYSVVDAFCDDRGHGDDTYNLSEAAGYSRTTHSGWGDGVATVAITETGKLAFRAAEALRTSARSGGEVTREAVEVIIALVERFERVDAPKPDRDLFRRAINARSGLLALISPAHREAQPKAGGGGEAVTCQSCGGEIQGWTCQGCGATFRENDAGVLVRATPEGQTEGGTVAVPVDVVERAIRWLRRPKNDLNSYAVADDLSAALASKGV